MDLDLGLISAVVRGGYDSFHKAKRCGIGREVLKGPAIEAWNFLDNHVNAYGKMPSEEFFLAKGKLQLVESLENLEVYIDEIRKRELWLKLSSSYEKIGKKLEARNPDEAYKFLLETARTTRDTGLSPSKIESLLRSGEDVLNYYERIKAGERGVLCPWKGINDVTLGFWPGDFVLFVARSEVGKTWCLLQLARQAWMDGKKVLFVGTEMAKLKLGMRFFAIHLRLPYEDLRRGRLGLEKEAELKRGVGDLLNEEGLNIVGDDFHAQMSDIEAAVDEIRPDILVVDGIYLVKNKGKDKYEMISQTADDMKILAKSRGIPVIASHQLNRAAGEKNPRDVSLANIAMSDVLVFNSDFIIAMVALEDDRADKIMHWKWLKVREGFGKPFITHWDFGEMNFEQTERISDDEFGDDDDYDSSPKPEPFDDAEGGDWLL